MSNLKSYFTTHVYKANLRSVHNRLAEQLLDEVLLLAEEDQAGLSWSDDNYLKGYTSYASANQLHLISPTFAELEKSIRTHVVKYLKQLKLQVPDLAMSTCWANIMGEGCTHPLHIHPQSVISGTYYLKMPLGASALRFEDPRYGLFMNRPPQDTHVSLKAQEGDLILFESWLRHDVPINTSKEPRLSISFNY